MRVETIGNAVLYMGTWQDVLPTLTQVDVVITDPPYSEITHAGARKSPEKAYQSDARKLITFDSISPDDFLQAAETFCRLARRWVVMTCDWKYLHLLDESGFLVRAGVWVKQNPTPQFTGDRPGQGWEAIAILHRPGRKHWNGGGKCAVYTDNVPKHRRVHPTQKPTHLISQFVSEYSAPGEVIFDPYMGSGTTGVAALQLGRKYIGVELALEYFDSACRRIEKAWNSRSLLRLAEQPQRVQGSLGDFKFM